MDRREHIFQLAKQALQQRTQTTYRRICQDYNNHRQAILGDFYQSIRCLIAKAKKLQSEHGKGPVKYVTASYLLSSAITGSYEFQLSIQDEQYFLDPVECSVDWRPSWLFSYAEEDRAAVHAFVGKEVPRLRPHELDALWRAYVCEFYYGLAGLFLAEHMSAAAEAEGLRRLHLMDEVLFVFGGFMDHAMQLDAWKGNHGNEVLSAENRSAI